MLPLPLYKLYPIWPPPSAPLPLAKLPLFIGVAESGDQIL